MAIQLLTGLHADEHTQYVLWAARQPSVNGDWLSQWEMAIFDPLQNRHPLTDHQKTVTGDYVGDPYSCAKFGAHPPLGFLGEWVKYNLNFVIYAFFGNSPTGQMRRRIFAHDSSNDAVLCKDVPA